MTAWTKSSLMNDRSESALDDVSAGARRASDETSSAATLWHVGHTQLESDYVVTPNPERESAIKAAESAAHITQTAA
jgi:hypothetical protein